MVYLVQAVAKANELLSPSTDRQFAPGDRLEQLAGAGDLVEAAAALDLSDGIPAAEAAALTDFLTNLPPAVDKTILLATRDALDRGLRVHLSWQPGTTTQVNVFETSKQTKDGLKGAVHIALTSPDPEVEAGLT